MTMLGKKHSEETKRKMKENHPRYWQGKKLPDEAKEKISKSLIGNKRREGTIPWNRKNKKEKMQTNRNYYYKQRAWIDELKSVPCGDCGGNFPPECMDFDHVRGIKIFEISKKPMTNKEIILTEISKCDIICSNCHRIRTRKSGLLRKRRVE